MDFFENALERIRLRCHFVVGIPFPFTCHPEERSDEGSAAVSSRSCGRERAAFFDF
jgi:hypothetical protein